MSCYSGTPSFSLGSLNLIWSQYEDFAIIFLVVYFVA